MDLMATPHVEEQEAINELGNVLGLLQSSASVLQSAGNLMSVEQQSIPETQNQNQLRSRGSEIQYIPARPARVRQAKADGSVDQNRSNYERSRVDWDTEQQIELSREQGLVPRVTDPAEDDAAATGREHAADLNDTEQSADHPIEPGQI